MESESLRQYIFEYLSDRIASNVFLERFGMCVASETSAAVYVWERGNPASFEEVSSVLGEH
jgi:hypothetical protein